MQEAHCGLVLIPNTRPSVRLPVGNEMLQSPLIRLSAGLFLSLFCGAVFTYLNIPLGWLMGALAGGMLATNIFGEVKEIRALRKTGQLLLGVATSGVMTEDVLQTIISLLPLMVITAILSNLVGLAFSLPLMRFAHLDRLTALLSSLPAGATEMAAIAAEMGGRVETVIVAHTLRVLLVVLMVPMFITVSGGLTVLTDDATGTVWALVLCLVGGAFLAFLAEKAKFLNAFIVIPILFGAVLVACGLPVAPMPKALVILAQILIGYSLGCRLNLERFAKVSRLVIVSGFCSIGLISATILVLAPVLSRLAGVDLTTTVLAAAPGGLGEMIASAKFTGSAVGVVAGFHIVRASITNMFFPPVILRLAGVDRR